MNILMLNTYDEWGGAAKAAFRLNRGVQGIGIESRLLVQGKSGDANDVIGTNDPLAKFVYGVRAHFGTMPVRLYPNKPVYNFTPALVPDNLAGQVAAIAPDILHLHWLGAGFIRIETLKKFRMPIVWTLHDSWAFSGGCHMPYECVKYRESCGSCPVLGSDHEADLSRWIWRRKKSAWQDLNLTLVTPSSWLADCAGASSLFRNRRIEVIPNGLDLSLFKPIEKRVARDLLRLSQDKKYILFGATNSSCDPNKGFQFLLPALQILSAKGQKANTELLVFGSSEPPHPDLPRFGMKANYLGRVHEEVSLALLYSAADVLVVPSIQENLPNIVMESMACGTPCVAFNQGGVPELIEHEQTGYLARPFETDDLARGILWVLENKDRRNELSFRSRRKVELEFDLDLVARRYAALYQGILEYRQEMKNV
jgi:glycosyltransferase involved in cell wall biosynthesis